MNKVEQVVDVVMRTGGRAVVAGGSRREEALCSELLAHVF